MQDGTVINFNADLDDLSDKTRFPNMLRICYTNLMYVTSLTSAFAARHWDSIVRALIYI